MPYGPGSSRERHDDRSGRSSNTKYSQESLRALAKRYGINLKTVTKWKKRSSVADLRTGPKEPKSTSLSIEDEAIIVAFRKHTLLRREKLDEKGTERIMPDNGQVERMNRTIKEATVKRLHYETHDQLRSHLAGFVSAYNFARRLETLKGFTPYEFICKAWTKEPERFTLNPLHQMPGLNI